MNPRETPIRRTPGAGTIALAGALGVLNVVVVFGLARLFGTDFTVSAPPAVTSPLPLWLFVLYSVGAALAMFAVVPIAARSRRPRALAGRAVALGLAAMTPAPFLVTSDFLTIFWLTSAHIALVAPMFALARKLSVLSDR